MQRRLLVVSDSDSYTKWGAALASTLPPSWEADLVVVGSTVLPSDRQLRVALAGTRWQTDVPRSAHLDELAPLVGDLRPDAVLLALRGPLVRVIAPMLQVLPDRPVLVSGFPGLTIPAVPKAVVYREQTDLVVLHSRREVREFAALAEDLPAAPAFGLATLPFLAARAAGSAVVDGAGGEARDPEASDVVFAVQAKVPATREERVALVGMLAAAARRQPRKRFVVKVRARKGEAQTHDEQFDLADLIADPAVTRELGATMPANLVVADGPMAEHLAQAEALVTVSSTAVLEAIAAGVPALLLDEFGVGAPQLNLVFEGSGLFGDAEALAAGDWRVPDADWLADNYFHERGADDWLAGLEALVASRDATPLPALPRHHNLAGGALRRAFERRRMLGAHDRSLLGTVSVLVAVPSRAALRAARKARRRLRGEASAIAA
ncbi:hypothetical protein ET445_07855 [Agromyces protaetiae]|uniref:Uncharacterized protein n=1 Tax=Agromyces protaetiae TaxID=2509455 RepID=A0A4P6FBB1_9MICO|nr:hypothetical protein ET445_07855 [Agromyces protaetiae]